MRCSYETLSLLGLAAASTVSAGIVAVPFARREAEPVPNEYSLPELLRRGASLHLDAINNLTGGGYYATFGIGTPPQNLSFLLDTGSSDTWVNSVRSDLCSSRSEQLRSGFCFKQFDSTKSSTFKTVSRGGFSISYLDGHDIQGDYFNDSVLIDGATVKNQQLGLALDSSRPTGIMGLGFSVNVASRIKYPTVIDNMVSQKLIASPAFSLYLNDLNTNEGTILFGGVDTEKITGGLATLPLQPQPQTQTNSPTSKTNDIVSYTVNLAGFSASGVDTPSVSAGAILDSGSTITLLPDAVVSKIYSHYGVKSVPQIPTPFIDCKMASSTDTFSFKFGPKTIKVPMDEMVINSFASVQDQLLSDPTLKSIFGGWSGVCLFGIASTANYRISSSNFALLGDTFLRSAYVVYDMANKQIGIGQAKLNATSSNIVEFQAGAKSIPGPVSTDSGDSSNSGSLLMPSFGIAIAGTLIMSVATIMSAL